eukprot:CAMPEP_0116870698 /NCGR_PEP_ID=MMETSP0463-20121206/719_1 /TAXON_ID=181622 /ORGANISM="Strombidinopsis sp, Strain SopsisLIS2011" /LENGTH=71 /DNA_ID=CAMNT_0004507721 /DNA_START=4157 /DNA_END=4372 /DNA_ORIENTATION=+
MGEFYASSPLSSIEYLFGSANCTTPIIFVLSMGADPTEQIIKYAQNNPVMIEQDGEEVPMDLLKYISLGQG